MKIEAKAGEKSYEIKAKDDALRAIAMLTGKALPSEISKVLDDHGVEIAQKTPLLEQMGGEPSVSEDDPIVVLFYLLLRDHIQPGGLEQVMMDLEQIDGDDTWTLFNTYLAGYGANLAARLRKLDC